MKKIALNLLDIVSRTIIMGFVTLIILLAIATSVLRYYLPEANSYRDQIFALISEKTGFDLHSDALFIDWHSFEAEIRLSNLQVKQKYTGHNINLANVHVVVDVAKSLFYRHIYLANLEFDSMDISLQQNAEGQWLVSNNANKKTDPIALRTVLDNAWYIDNLSLNNIQLSLVPYQQEALLLPQVSIELQTWINSKILKVVASEQGLERSRLIIQTRNRPEDKNFSSEIYWQTEKFPLHSILPLISGLGFSRTSYVSSEVWLTWENQQFSGSGQFAIDKLLLNKGKAWQVSNVKGQFYVEQEGAEVALAIPKLQGTVNKKTIDLEKVKLVLGKQFKIQMQSLDLAVVDNYLSLFDLSEKLAELKHDLQAKGQLENIQISLLPNDFLLRANLQDISVGAWKGAPAVQHLNGYVEAQKKAGFVQINSQDFVLAFPELYNTDMQFKRAKGRVFWRIEDKIYVGSEGQVYLSGDYGKAQGEFQLVVPIHREIYDDPPRLSLIVNLKEGDAKYKNHLIPSILDAHLLQWINDNIHAGKVNQGALIYHGPIGHKHPSNEQRVVQLWLDVSQAELSYDARLPKITQVSGQLLLDQKHLLADISSGNSAGLTIDKARLDLDLTQDPYLQVAADFKQQAARDVMAFLQQPLFESYSKHILDAWQVPEGKVDARVQVLTPIKRLQELNVLVDAHLLDVALEMPKIGLNFNDIDGDLSVNLKQGITAKKLTGKLWQHAFSASISHGRYNQVDFQGQVAQQDLKNWLNLPVLDFLQGKTAVKGRIYWDDKTSAMTMQSDLKGMAIDLPEPLGKKAQQIKPLKLHLDFAAQGKKLQLISQGLQLNLSLDKNNQVQSGLLNLGVVSSHEEQGKIKIQGQLQKASIEQWLAVVKHYQNLSAQEKTKSDSTFNVEINGLSVQNLNFFGYPIRYARLALKNLPEATQFSLDNRFLSGEITLSKQAAAPLAVHIKKLDLSLLQAAGKTFSTDQLNVKSFVDLPAMDVKIDALHQGQEDYGNWQFKFRQHKDSLQLQEISGDLRYMHFAKIDDKRPCQLIWYFAKQENTQFQCRLDSGQIDKVLSSWGQAISAHSEEFSAIITDGRWLGGPLDFALDKLDLSFYLAMNKGYFADVSSSASNTLKVFSLLNLGNIIRRLKLDFSDLSQKGLAFDKVRGQFDLTQGLIKSTQPLSIKGSSSDIRMQGSADFNKNLLDVDMSVSFPLASNIPWIVALAAGLPAAVGVLVVTKLLGLGKQVNKLTTALYHVDGPINEPNIQFKRLVDVDDNKADQEPKTNDKTSETKAVP